MFHFSRGIRSLREMQVSLKILFGEVLGPGLSSEEMDLRCPDL